LRTSLERSLVLGRFRVLYPVDEKKLIKAYIARDERGDESDTPVLIKQFLHELPDLKSSAADALFSELDAIERLRLPGVVTLLGHGVDQDSLVTAQLHRPGISLLRLCELFKGWQRPFPAPLAIYIIRRLLWTLHQCHNHPEGPFVHGHLTPASIHLPRWSGPEVSDFCLARLEDAAAEAEAQIGFFQARMSYVAPEVSRDGLATPLGDTYSLALMLYRLLSGSNPLKARSVTETLQRVLRHAPEALHVPAWDHSEQASAILTRALSKDPAHRYESSKALYDELEAVQTGADDALAEELSQVITSTDSDWGRIALLAHSTRHSRKARDPDRIPAVEHFESAQPAFASGPLTEQPTSMSEHTQRSQQACGPRRRAGTWLVLAAVLPAVMTSGLLLGRLSSGRASGAMAPDPVESETTKARVVSELRARLGACSDGLERAGPNAKLDLDFDVTGKLGAIRLYPPELVHSRLGACLLGAAWKTEPGAPGTLSLVIAPGER
jgi:serine/threonine protein kinase